MRLLREKAEDWHKAVSADSGSQIGDDCFEQLDRLKAVGQSYTWSDGGKDEVLHTLSLITLCTATSPAAPAKGGYAGRDIYFRQGSDHSVGPSRAIKRAWDAG